MKLVDLVTLDNFSFHHFSSAENIQRHERAQVGQEAAEAFVPAEPQEASGHRGQVEQLEAPPVEAAKKTAEGGSAGLLA